MTADETIKRKTNGILCHFKDYFRRSVYYFIYSMEDAEARKNSHSSLENKASRIFHGYA